jgi:hypothetical protein
MQVQNAIFGGVESVQYELCTVGTVRYGCERLFLPWAAAALELLGGEWEWLGPSR